jgi:superfamily I DNA/RNA helicase
MVCKANPGRAGEGGIKTVSFAPDSTEAAAAWMADSILSEVKEGIEPGGESHAGYDSFGVGLRTNAEAYIYGMELLKRGIPFKSKVNFFRDTNAKALLGWLTIADEGLDGNEDRINQAVIERCHRAPLAGLGKKTMEKIRENATGNYIVWLRDNWGSIYGRRGQWAARIKSYVDNLVKVATMEFEDQEDLLNEILQLTGYNDESVRDAMIDRIKGDKETMAEIMAQSSTGEIDEDLVEEAALAPIDPIKGLLNARADLVEAMKYTRQLERANEKLTAVDDPSAQGFEEPAVTLGTMHSWKGLEVPHMYIPMVGGRFPRGGSEEDLASERRLAYVAITRGEDKVTVMDIPTTRNVDGKPVVFTSQFIEEMCVPMEAALPAEAVAEIDEEGAMKTAAPFVSLPAGVSPQDPALMDAYLEGDSDPLDDYEEESMSNLEDEWVF